MHLKYLTVCFLICFLIFSLFFLNLNAYADEHIIMLPHSQDNLVGYTWVEDGNVVIVEVTNKSEWVIKSSHWEITSYESKPYAKKYNLKSTEKEILPGDSKKFYFELYRIPRVKKVEKLGVHGRPADTFEKIRGFF